MSGDLFSINNFLEPQILIAENDFLIVYKAPKMHSAPLAKSKGTNILYWCAEKHSEIMELNGRRAGEGGLIHRLDYETRGLMIIARNRRGLEGLLEQQQEGRIIKEYSALGAKIERTLPGFPDRRLILAGKPSLDIPRGPLLIQSAFRPYGLGRKAVRPCLSSDKPSASRSVSEKRYSTEILESQIQSSGFVSLRLRISKGFRHQIRCHLTWLGMPILNDSQYGGISYGKGYLALKACSLCFSDPSSGIELNYAINTIDPDEV